MRGYYFGNRRRLQHLAGPSIGVSNTYVTQVSAGSKSTTPVDASLVRFGIQTYTGETTPTTDRVVSVYGKEMYLPGLRTPQTYIQAGRDRPVRVAVGSLASDPFREPGSDIFGILRPLYTQESIAENFTARIKDECNAIIAFLEKTPDGFGKRYLKFYFRQIRQTQSGGRYGIASYGSAGAPFDSVFPLDGKQSIAPVGDEQPTVYGSNGNTGGGFPCIELLTVSEMNDGSETVLANRLVPIGSRLKIAMAKEEDEPRKLVVNIYGQDLFHIYYPIPGGVFQEESGGFVWSDTIEIDWDMPSQDAAVCGLLLPNYVPQFALPSQFSGVQEKGEESPLATSLPVHDVSHDSVTHMPFVAGMLSIPDVDTQGLFSSQRSDYVQSELSNRFACKTVRSLPGISAEAPTQEGDSTRVSPIPAVSEAPERFLAEYFPASRNAVEATTLESAGHLIMCDAEARMAALPSGEAFCFGDKTITSVTVTLTAETRSGSWSGPLFSSTPTSGEERYLPFPNGEFNCDLWTIGSVAGRAIFRGEAEFRNSTYPWNNVDLDGNPTVGTMTVKSRAEVFVILFTSLQGAGEYDPGSDLEGITRVQQAANRITSPDNPRGRVGLVQYHTPDLPPSPIIGARLIMRGVSFTDYNPPWPTYPLGFLRGHFGHDIRGYSFIQFNKEQSQRLVDGETVRATQWRQGHPDKDAVVLSEAWGLYTSVFADLKLNE